MPTCATAEGRSPSKGAYHQRRRRPLSYVPHRRAPEPKSVSCARRKRGETTNRASHIPRQAIGRTETQQQSRMHRALRQDATTGHFYHRARVWHVGRGAAPHQGVFSTHTRRVPGIEHCDSVVVRARFDAQPSCIAQSSAVERSCTAGHTEPQAADQRKQCPTPPLHVVSRVTSPASEVFIFALTTSRSVS